MHNEDATQNELIDQRVHMVLTIVWCNEIVEEP